MSTPKEWGNGHIAHGLSPMVLDVLHREAAAALAPGHRYEIRMRARGPSDVGSNIAWYAHELMREAREWGAHGLQDGGYYLVGQYVVAP